MKQILLLFSLLVSAVNAFAFPESYQGVGQYKGLWYHYYETRDANEETSSYTAKVIKTKGAVYTGDIVIPEKMQAKSQCDRNLSDFTVDHIDAGAFMDCTGITSVSFPKTLTRIDKDAFKYCETISIVTLHEGMKTVGDNAFWGCNAVTKYVLPSTLTTIGKQAFGRQGYLNYEVYDFAATPQKYTADKSDYYPFGVDKGVSITLYVLPSAVEAYKADPMFGKMNIQVPTFEYKGRYYLMTSETTAELIANTKNPYTGDVNDIPSTVTFNDFKLNVTRIGDGAFKNCTGLKSITIPSFITSIGNEAFYGCTGLKTINAKSEKPQTLGNDVFGGIDELFEIALNVPKTKDTFGVLTAVKKYQAADIWKEFFILPGTVVQDGVNYITYDGMTAKVTTSAKGAYVNLAEANIRESIEMKNHILTVDGIEDNAFMFAAELTKVTIPQTIKTIGKYVFCMCNALTTISTNATTPQSVADNFGLGDKIKNVTLYINPRYYEAFAKADSWKNLKMGNVLVDDLETPYTNTTTTEFTGMDFGYYRDFTSTKWQALYVPFDIPFENIENDFEVAEINELHEAYQDGMIVGPSLNIKKVTSGTIEHSKPYLIKPKKEGAYVIVVAEATLYPAETYTASYSSQKVFDCTITGNYEVKSGLTNCRDYALSDGKFCTPTDATVELAPYRWYITLSGKKAGAKKVSVITLSDEEVVVDGIDKVNVNDNDDDNKNIYSLGGQLLSAPQKGQINIINGKKVIVK